MADEPTPTSRREFMHWILRGAALVTIAGGAGYLATRTARLQGAQVWQIAPRRCIRCGRCASACVKTPSAVKCVHAFSACGYCNICSGYFTPKPEQFNTGAENQLCPVNAIVRKSVEDPYYAYTIDWDRCIGCGRCVQGCQDYGNGSLYLQISHAECQQCNQCAIATQCPAGAISRKDADKAYNQLTGARGD
ncbi:MAG: 4Fe-4S binding protein [Phycisphaerae bacterium]